MSAVVVTWLVQTVTGIRPFPTLAEARRWRDQNAPGALIIPLTQAQGLAA